MRSSASPAKCAPTRDSNRLLAASLALSLVAGCGGGGGAPPPPPPPPPPTANQAPVFTSGNSATTIENNGGAVYQATATDAEGSAIAFSIVGGADSTKFSITPGGQLSFSAPPNFDLPGDADGNNVYQVEIGASDGQIRTNLALSVTVSNSKEGIAVRRIATGFDDPTAMGWAYSSSSFLIAERNGAIYSFDGKSGNRIKVIQVPSVGDLGVLAVTRTPGGSSIFVMYTSSGSLIVQEYVYDNSVFKHVPRSFGPVLQVAAPDYAGGGWLGFDPGGTLEVATGDAGGTGDPSGSAQNDASLLGKLIGVTGGGTQSYKLTLLAKGLHQPVGGVHVSTPSAVGLLIGDRGQAVADEVDFVPHLKTGSNFGWPFKEGFQIVRGTPPAGVVDPVVEYPRMSAAAVHGIIGGAYAGVPVQAIAGDYVFADRSGVIFTLPITRMPLQNVRAGLERRTADFVPDVGAINQPVAIVGDFDDRLYILDADGEVFVVEAG